MANPKPTSPGDNLVDEIKAAANALADVTIKTPKGLRQARALDALEVAGMIAVKGVFYDDANRRREA
jgi:hypothetical protein